jgi:Stress up-regulated Nod 19
MDPIGTQLARQISGFCTDCNVLYTKAGLVFENGTEATVDHGVYEHHIVMVDLAKRTFPFYLCNGQSGFLGMFPAVGFMVSGNDPAANMFTTPDGSFNSAYHIGQYQMLAMQAELVNYRKEAQKVYITVDYEYTKGKANNPADSVISLFSVTGCGFPDYHRDASKKIYNMSSEVLIAPADGFIINAKGHLHDGGDHIILTQNGKTICDSHAIYGPQKEEGGIKWSVIEQMEQCTKPVKVTKGDKLQMTSFYDTEKHPPRPTLDGVQGHSHADGSADEMGVFFINFAATNKTAAAMKLKGV